MFDSDPLIVLFYFLLGAFALGIFAMLWTAILNFGALSVLGAVAWSVLILVGVPIVVAAFFV